MNKIKQYFHNLIICGSQVLNTLIGGCPDETISARAWRKNNIPLIFFINGVFFWQNNHCRGAYHQEKTRKHQHRDYN